MTKPILQYGSLAGWPHKVAKALRAQGCQSVNVVPEDADVEDLDRKLPYDRAIARKSAPKPVKLLKRAAFVFSAAQDYSLVHYHGGVILRSDLHPHFEGALLQARDIPMLMSFGGGDARNISAARAANPFFYLPEDPARDARTRKYLTDISRRIRFAATDCEMARYVGKYFDKCFVFRQPVDLDEVSFVEPDVDRPPIFLHVPTQPWVKGTDQIVAAAERLKSEGYCFEFKMKRQLSQAEMYREILDCDVYIDELRCGSHGVTAAETMAAGKPTITYIRPDLVGEYPADLPIVNANPETIYDRMRELIGEPARRRELSYASRAYAEKYHDARVVARDLLAIYREMGLDIAPSASAGLGA